MMRKDFANTLYVGPKREPQFIEYPAHETLEGAVLACRTRRDGKVQVAEYKLVRVVEVKMIPEIMAEVG